MRNSIFKSQVKRVTKRIIGSIVRPYIYLHQINTTTLTVFNYHDVTDNPSPFQEEFGLNVSTDTFKRQISWISDNFNIIHPEDVVNHVHFPKRAALITFDDGFLGAFENGFDYLKSKNIPSIMFLNMRTVIQQRPMFSAIACYLGKHVQEFNHFAKKEKILRPYHLTIGPMIFSMIEEKLGKIDLNEVWKYQGVLVDIKTIQYWDNEPTVAFGNHLFDHWNALILNADEFEEQYKRNETELSQLKNTVSLFAFTNGQPETCFSNRDIKLLKKYGAKRLFSTHGGVNHNPNNYLLGRLSLVDKDNNEGAFWFRIFQAICADRFVTKLIRLE